MDSDDDALNINDHAISVADSDNLSDVFDDWDDGAMNVIDGSSSVTDGEDVSGVLDYFDEEQYCNENVAAEVNDE